MEQFNQQVEDLLEGYGMFKQTIRQRFPKNLKLSEDFIQAFKEEFVRQTAAVMEEDSEGNQVETRAARKPQKVLEDFQKALQFLVPQERL
jgi:hypothetical protein